MKSWEWPGDEALSVINRCALIRTPTLFTCKILILDMAENKVQTFVDGDSGVVSEQRPHSRDGSPVTEREGSLHSVLSFSQVTDGVLVVSETHGSEPPSSDTEKAASEERVVIPMLETQGPSSSGSHHNGAHFSIGAPEEESGRSEQGASVLLLQEAQKAIAREKMEQEMKLCNTEAKLKETEDKLMETKDQLAEAKQKLMTMTKKKNEVEKKLEEVQAERAKELKMYKDEMAKYKERLADAEKKNETQRAHYEDEIKKLALKMEQKEKEYDKNLLQLTKESCDLKLQVAHMETEEQSLKRRIAELERDLERKDKENLAQELEVLRSNSVKQLAHIQDLERQLSKASLDSNSS